jgi:hypothetical protein
MTSPVGIELATRDAGYVPNIAICTGIIVHEDRRRVTVLVPVASAAPCVRDLAENGLYALVFSRPTDHRSIQLKGSMLSIAEADESYRPELDRYLATYGGELELIGIPASIIRRLTTWPCWAIELEVREIFEQTPGPGAGARIEAPRETR